MSDIFDQLKQLADGKVYVNTTNGGNAILRSQATTMSAKLTTIPWGTELDAIGYEAGGQSADGSGFTFWYKVNYNGKTGFVFGKLLSNVKPTGPKPSSGSGGSSGGGSSEDKVVTVIEETFVEKHGTKIGIAAAIALVAGGLWYYNNEG